LRNQVFDSAKVEAGPDGAVVHLENKDEARRQGIARVTVFGENNVPLAERIVFRNRRAGLQLELALDKKRYSPRDPLELSVTTKNTDGKPVAAQVAVSIVDDTVVSFADDKTGHMTSRLLFESEIPGEVEEPKFFLDLTEKKSALALELLMGTRGYRRFDWQPALNPVGVSGGVLSMFGSGAGIADGAMDEGVGGLGVKGRGAGVRRRGLARAQAALPGAMPAAAPPPPDPEAQPQPVEPNEAPPVAAKLAAAAPKPALRRERRARPMMDLLDAEEAEAPVDDEWAKAELFQKRKAAPPRYAPVREFPMPTYTGELTGVRDDFRDTIYWSPAIDTGEDGTAKVRIFLSDAVTSFRVFAEGAGDNAIGRKEKVFESSLPFSLNVKLPLEVSAGDRPRIPLTLTNERDTRAEVSLTASFGDQVRVVENPALPS
ncbi:MAG: alpha-2-macroglobulin family protein, partial [Myxococcota bacterium]